VQENFLNGGGMPANFFAMDSTAAVINYVHDNPGAIGIISVSWITDPEDKVTKAFREKIDVVGILNNTLTDHPERVRYPFQAYVFDKSYPFTRDVYAIRTGLKGTVGTGFISFLNGEKGQLMLLRRQQELSELKIKPEISKHEYEEPILSPSSQYATSFVHCTEISSPCIRPCFRSYS
jgi:phosphate transport system substrate-binding protein